MPGTVIGRTGSLFLFGIGIVWLLIWLILAYSSKQKSTLAVLAVFSLIGLVLDFGEPWLRCCKHGHAFCHTCYYPSRYAESGEPVSARSAANGLESFSQCSNLG